MNSPRQKCSRNVLFRFYPNVYIIFLCAGISFVCYMVLCKDVLLFQKKYFPNFSVEQRIARKQPQSKLILLYTQFFGKKWPDYAVLGPLLWGQSVQGLWSFFMFGDLRQKQAVASRCDRISRTWYAWSSAQRSTNQIWFYFVLENPINAVMDAYAYARVFFEWTVTYKRDSKIYVPYWKYMP